MHCCLISKNNKKETLHELSSLNKHLPHFLKSNLGQLLLMMKQERTSLLFHHDAMNCWVKTLM